MSRARIDRRDRDAGFSVVEALVALAVFALAGVGLIGLQAHSLRTLGQVETRTLAGIAAQNKLVEAVAANVRPPLGDSSGELTLGGRRFGWRMSVMATADPATRRVSVAVFDPNAEGAGVSAHAFASATETP